jgi:hypothetical protein
VVSVVFTTRDTPGDTPGVGVTAPRSGGLRFGEAPPDDLLDRRVEEVVQYSEQQAMDDLTSS